MKLISNFRPRDWHQHHSNHVQSPSDGAPSLVSFSVSQLLNGDTYSSRRMETECILAPEYIIRQSAKYDPGEKYSKPFRKYLDSPLFSPEETEKLVSSPIFEKTREENKCLVPARVSHNNVVEVNIDTLPSNENHDERRRIEKIAVEAQIEIDQFSCSATRRQSSEIPFLHDVKTNPTGINLDTILADNVSYKSDTSRDQESRAGQNLSLSISGCPEMSDTSLINRILSSGKHLLTFCIH